MDKKKKMTINKQDIEGNYEVNVVAGNSVPMSNLCQFCGKCAQCEHPCWECPKLTDLKCLVK